MTSLLAQAGAAVLYYAGLIALVRLSGKRLAGQTTTFDLIVLISLAVVMQQLALREGPAHAITFILSVFAAHRFTAWACTRSRRFKRWVRGSPRPLIIRGEVSQAALEEEGLSYEDLLAGLRKLGEADPRRIRLATLEETGQISAVVELDPADRRRTGAGPEAWASGRRPGGTDSPPPAG